MKAENTHTHTHAHAHAHTHRTNKNKQHDLYDSKLLTLKFTPKTPIDTATDRGNTIRVSLLSKEEMVVVWLSETEEAEQFNGQFTDVFSKTFQMKIIK